MVRPVPEVIMISGFIEPVRKDAPVAQRTAVKTKNNELPGGLSAVVRYAGILYVRKSDTIYYQLQDDGSSVCEYY
jgi:hypothetical protein